MFCTNCGVALYEGAASCSACGRGVNASEEHAAPAKVAYAGFLLRALAFVIDSLVVAIPASLVIGIVVAALGIELPPPESMQIGKMPDMPTGTFLTLEAAFLLVHWVYFATMESSHWQGTLGKRALKIGVTDSQGRRVTFGRASARFFGKLASGLTFFLGYAMAAFTARKQALHDIIADCLVVKMP
jgi:uncharacterized RDD family membrane protein YckC